MGFDTIEINLVTIISGGGVGCICISTSKKKINIPTKIRRLNRLQRLIRHSSKGPKVYPFKKKVDIPSKIRRLPSSLDRFIGLYLLKSWWQRLIRHRSKAQKWIYPRKFAGGVGCLAVWTGS